MSRTLERGFLIKGTALTASMANEYAHTSINIRHECALLSACAVRPDRRVRDLQEPGATCIAWPRVSLPGVDEVVGEEGAAAEQVRLAHPYSWP
jgi:hypothetical protein